MEEVTRIKPDSTADHIPTALRMIADQLEAGDFGHMTSAVLIMGHTGSGPLEGDYTIQKERHEIFGLGPRHDAFTLRGLMLTAAMKHYALGSLESDEW